MKRNLFQILRFPDANTEGASSTSSAPAGGTANTDDNSGGPSDANAGKPDAKPQTLMDAVNERLKEGDADSSAADNAASESGSENEPNAGEGQEGEGQDDGTTEGAAKEGQDGKEGTEGTDKGPVPYDRFEQVVQERNTYKQQIELLKGKAENFDYLDRYCQEFAISGEQLQRVLRVQALLNTDPEAALKELMPIVEELQGFRGEKLPQDLQAAVDSGEMSLKWAQELAKNRAQTQFRQRSMEHQQQRSAQAQQAEARRQMDEAAAQWETAKRQSDPDYKPKGNANAPDGKWEDVRDKFTAMLHATTTNSSGETVYVNPVRNVKEMQALMERAYQAVHSRYTARNKPPTRKVLPSNGASGAASTKSIEQASTLSEAVKLALDGRK